MMRNIYLLRLLLDLTFCVTEIFMWVLDFPHVGCCQGDTVGCRESFEIIVPRFVFVLVRNYRSVVMNVTYIF